VKPRRVQKPWPPNGQACCLETQRPILKPDAPSASPVALKPFPAPLPSMPIDSRATGLQACRRPMQAFKAPLGPVFRIHSPSVHVLAAIPPEIVVFVPRHLSAPRKPAGQVPIALWCCRVAATRFRFLLPVPFVSVIEARVAKRKGPELGALVSLIPFHPFHPPFDFSFVLPVFHRLLIFLIDLLTLNLTPPHPTSSRGTRWCRRQPLSTSTQTNNHDAFPHIPHRAEAT
jgi:hypothetical protein